MSPMYKVKCVDCKDIGFTASPKFVKCSCGGRHKVIPFSKADLQDKGENRIASFLYGSGSRVTTIGISARSANRAGN